VLGDAFGAFDRIRTHVCNGEERDRVVTGLVQEHHVFAVGDPLTVELHAHPPPDRLSEQQPFR
jgi:hypothetical protein